MADDSLSEELTARWLSKPLIWLDDALWLSMPTPIKPPGRGFPETSLYDDIYAERREIAEQWITNGRLPHEIKPEEPGRDYYIKPLDFFRLAKEAEWIDLLNSAHDPMREFLAYSHTERPTPLTDEQLVAYLLRERWECYQAIELFRL